MSIPIIPPIRVITADSVRNCNKIYEINGGKATLRDKAEVIKES